MAYKNLAPAILKGYLEALWWTRPTLE